MPASRVLSCASFWDISKSGYPSFLLLSISFRFHSHFNLSFVRYLSQSIRFSSLRFSLYFLLFLFFVFAFLVIPNSNVLSFMQPWPTSTKLVLSQIPPRSMSNFSTAGASMMFRFRFHEININSLFRVGYLLIILYFDNSDFGLLNEIFVWVILG